MIKTMGFVVKQDGWTHEEFVERFREGHTPFGKDLPGVREYTTSVPVDPPGVIPRRPGGSPEASVPDGDGLVEYDLVSELYFDDMEAYRRAFSSDAVDRALADEAEFIEEIYFVVVELETHVDPAGSS